MKISCEDVLDRGDFTSHVALMDHPITYMITKSGWLWCGGLVGNGDDPEKGMLQALTKLESRYAAVLDYLLVFFS